MSEWVIESEYECECEVGGGGVRELRDFEVLKTETGWDVEKVGGLSLSHKQKWKKKKKKKGTWLADPYHVKRERERVWIIKWIYRS